MRHHIFPIILLTMPLCLSGATDNDQQLPKDAELFIKEFEEQVDAIELKADAEIRAKQQKLIERLQVLRDNLIKDENLDEGLEIHHVIKQMKAVFVEVEWNEQWFTAELIETRDDECLVTFSNAEQRQTVPKDKVRHPYHRRPTLRVERPAREKIAIQSRLTPKEQEKERDKD